MGDLTTGNFENMTKTLDLPKFDNFSDISFFTDFCERFFLMTFFLSEIIFCFVLSRSYLGAKLTY